MTTGHRIIAADHFDRTDIAPEPADYVFTLFVSGASQSSARAIANVRQVCDAHLSGHHRLTIVDLNQEPALADQHHVLATPTLVVHHPLPLRMLVGDMSDRLRLLATIDLRPGDMAHADGSDTGKPGDS